MLSASLTYRNKEWLKQNYVDKQLSCSDIAELCGIKSYYTVLNWLKRFKISRRSGLDTKTVSVLAKLKRNVRRGIKHPRWKGGKHVNADGYVLIRKPEHPDVNANGYVLEHRLVMEKKLGRRLHLKELVHHMNGVKDDNRPKNLILVVETNHYGEVVCPHCLGKVLVK